MRNILFRLLGLAFLAATLAGCDVLFKSSPDWTDLGNAPAPASTSANQTPMIVVDDAVIVGTQDGLWQRPLARSGDWKQLGLAGVSILAVRGGPTSTDTLFAAGKPVTDVEAAPFYRSDDSGITWTASTTWPHSSTDNSTETFFDLAIAPDNPERLYALFETKDHGSSVDQLTEPKTLNDPSVEQIAPLSQGNLAVLISESDGTERSLRLSELDPNGDIFH